MRAKHSISGGFSLVEVAVALAVASFAMIVIVGLLPVGIGAQKISLNETIATNLATGIIADLRQVPTVPAIALNASLSSKSARYAIDVTQPSTTLLLDESGAPLALSKARFKAVVSLTPPATGRTATYGSVYITWPPAASNPEGSVMAFVALDRN